MAERNIGTTEAPLYVPEGSPGAINYDQNIATQTPTPTPTTAPTTPIDTSQPSPATTAVQPASTAISGQVIGTLPGQTTPTTFQSADIAKQYGAALQTAKQTGQPPQDSGQARIAVQNALQANPVPPSTANIDTQLAQDKGYNQLLADYNEYNNVVNQSKSLLDTYNEMVKTSGLEAINQELISSKRIIEGTEDDIRSEVQAAQGFATESQIQALASSRNKQLIRNYNTLVDQANNIRNQVSTMVTLAGQDREFAINAALQRLNVNAQLLEYRDKFVRNAQEAYKNVINAVGYKGLLESLQNSGDPSAIALAEKTMGFAPGQLAEIVTAQQAQQNLENLSQYNITTPYVITASGEVQNTQTGEGYTDPADFQAKTGMTLDQAGQKGLIARLGLTKEDEQTQFERQLDLAKFGLDQDRFQFEQDRFVFEASQPDLKTQIIDQNGKKIAVTTDSQGNVVNEVEIGAETGSGANQQQLATAQGNISSINDVLEKLSRPTSVGVGPNATFRNLLVNPFSSKKGDFIAGVEQIVDQLNLDKLIESKAQGATFGALSDNELRVLASAATKIGTWRIKDDKGNVIGYNTSGKSLQTELDKINNYAKLDYILKGGNADDVGVKLEANGAYTTVNSDGTVTELIAPQQQGPGFNSAGKPQASKSSTPYLKTLGAITGYGSSAWKYGLDVDLKKGDPVKSPVSGKVIASGYETGFGNTIKIQDSTGQVWRLSHLDRLGVKSGQTINAGNLIGLGGNTGKVIPVGGGDGSHLDITIYRNGKPIAAREVKKILDKTFV